MSRLTTTIREKMAVALVKHRFSERASLLVAENQALFRLVYSEHYSPRVQEHMRAIAKNHAKAFLQKERFVVSVMGQRFDLGREELAHYWSVRCELVPALADLDRYDAVISLGVDSPLNARVLQFANDRLALSEACGLAYREALGTLNCFNTGKALAKDWPESLPIIGDLIPEDNRTLPVIQVAELNRAFGLPPK